MGRSLVTPTLNEKDVHMAFSTQIDILINVLATSTLSLAFLN